MDEVASRHSPALIEKSKEINTLPAQVPLAGFSPPYATVSRRSTNSFKKISQHQIHVSRPVPASFLAEPGIYSLRYRPQTGR